MHLWIRWNQTKMGLKSNISEETAEFWRRWNQTKMGLKSSSHQTRPFEKWRVEIRPRWDWNFWKMAEDGKRLRRLKSDQDGIEIKFLAKDGWGYIECWNQTKMGLKFSSLNAFMSLFAYLLKSDQDGIEIPNACTTHKISQPLKSDQDGIEMSPLHKIAKRGNCLCWNQTKMGLKFLPCSNMGNPHIWCWNQTKMGLKCTTRGLCIVAVRGWNQTKMGLKSLNSLSSSFFFSIRLKSDQDGIEMWRLSCPQWSARKGWNQTKMGLK